MAKTSFASFLTLWVSIALFSRLVLCRNFLDTSDTFDVSLLTSVRVTVNGINFVESGVFYSGTSCIFFGFWDQVLSGKSTSECIALCAASSTCQIYRWSAQNAGHCELTSMRKELRNAVPHSNYTCGLKLASAAAATNTITASPSSLPVSVGSTSTPSSSPVSAVPIGSPAPTTVNGIDFGIENGFYTADKCVVIGSWKGKDLATRNDCFSYCVSNATCATFIWDSRLTNTCLYSETSYPLSQFQDHPYYSCGIRLSSGTSFVTPPITPTPGISTSPSVPTAAGSTIAPSSSPVSSAPTGSPVPTSVNGISFGIENEFYTAVLLVLYL